MAKTKAELESDRARYHELMSVYDDLDEENEVAVDEV